MKDSAGEDGDAQLECRKKIAFFRRKYRRTYRVLAANDQTTQRGKVLKKREEI